MHKQCYSLLAAVALCACVLATLASTASSADARPNIVLLMADDLGYECLNCNGGESYFTPHLDQLAADGVRFTHAYSQPVCTPSRVKLMTGLSNVRNYVDFGLLKKGSRTFGHMLQEAGYKTAIVGKWQLLGTNAEKAGKGTHPSEAGFDEYCLWQVRQRNSRYWHPRIDQNGDMLETTSDDFGPDIYVNYSKDFITRHKDQPFFVYFPMALTHAPFVHTPANKDQGKLDRQKGFAGMVTYTDEIVGRLIAHLQSLGIAGRTLFLFTGDNGTHGSIYSVLNGRTIKGGKGHTTDAGTHVPLVASWPGTIKPSVCNDLVDFSDFVPTLAEACGARHPYPELADGRSFLPQLIGKPGNPREWFYCFYHPRTGPGSTARRFVRNHRWKLYGDGRLFDVEADSDELSPVDPATASDDARAARSKLQSALDSMPSELVTSSP